MEQSVVEKRTLAFRPFAVMTFSGNLKGSKKSKLPIFLESLYLRDTARECGGQQVEKTNQYQEFLGKYQCLPS